MRPEASLTRTKITLKITGNLKIKDLSIDQRLKTKLKPENSQINLTMRSMTLCLMPPRIKLLFIKAILQVPPPPPPPNWNRKNKPP
jgi:hypothetical protein